MPSRYDWHSQIKSVKNEFRASKIALDYLLSRVDSEPKALLEDLRPRDFIYTLNTLDRTFFIRIFSEFEGCLRSYYSSYRSTEPMMSQLIDSIGAHRKMPPARIAAVHSIRESRNLLIHTPFAIESIQVNIESAHSSLQRFVAFLPEAW